MKLWLVAGIKVVQICGLKVMLCEPVGSTAPAVVENRWCGAFCERDYREQEISGRHPLQLDDRCLIVPLVTYIP